MSGKSKTTQKTKAQIAQENIELRQQLAQLSNIQDQLTELVSENKKLRERAKTAENKESYVGIRSTCEGLVWLPSPESFSGLPEDRNKGKLLKSGQVAIVPSYWMVQYISNQSKSFIDGNVVMDNEAAKLINRGVDFVDIELPDAFVEASLIPSEIKRLFNTGTIDAILDFIETHKNKKAVIQKIYNYAQNQATILRGTEKKKVESVVKIVEDILFGE